MTLKPMTKGDLCVRRGSPAEKACSGDAVVVFCGEDLPGTGIFMHPDCYKKRWCQNSGSRNWCLCGRYDLKTWVLPEVEAEENIKLAREWRT